jgi:hypothetical protein
MPKHRANKIVKTEPRLQLPGRHVGPSEFDRTPGRHERTTAELMNLAYDMTVGNPYRGRA